MSALRKMTKKWKVAASLAAFAAASMMLWSEPAPVAFAAPGITMENTWDGAIVEHKGFRDLGNYVIELPDFTDAAMGKKGMDAFYVIAERGDIPRFGCTSMVKRNSRGRSS